MTHGWRAALLSSAAEMDVSSGAAARNGGVRLITVAVMLYLTVGSSPSWMLFWIPADLVVIPLYLSVVAMMTVSLLVRRGGRRS